MLDVDVASEHPESGIAYLFLSISAFQGCQKKCVDPRPAPGILLLTLRDLFYTLGRLSAHNRSGRLLENGVLRRDPGLCGS